MDLKNIKINYLAKANFVFAIISPPDKSGGNSKVRGNLIGDNSNAYGNSNFYGSSIFNRNVAQNFNMNMALNLNRNVASAHSIINYQNPFGFSQNDKQAVK
jgi:hypothetical protein